MQSKLAAAIALATFCYLWGQSAPGPLSFDVASVKPAAPDARGTSIQSRTAASARSKWSDLVHRHSGAARVAPGIAERSNRHDRNRPH